MKHHNTWWMVIFWALATPTLAWAQDDGSTAEEPGPTDMDYELAEKVAVEATTAYSNKEYGEAINLYVTAHEYVPAAIFLASAARAAFDAGSLMQAKRLVERALAIESEDYGLNPSERASFEQMRHELDAKIAAELAKTGEWSWVGYSGAGVASLGVAGLVGALVLDARVGARREELGASTRKDEYDALYAELSGQQDLGKAFLYAGSGLVLLGGGLVAWDLLTPGGVPYKAPTLSLELAPTRAHVTVGWKW